MSWNYRIVRNARPGGDTAYTIHEAFYPSDIEDQYETKQRRAPKGIAPEPYAPMGTSIGELQRELDFMQKALNDDYLEGENYHVRVRYERKRKSLAEDLNRRLRTAESAAKDWKKKYLQANTERIALQRQIDDIKRRVEDVRDKFDGGRKDEDARQEASSEE